MSVRAGRGVAVAGAGGGTVGPLVVFTGAQALRRSQLQRMMMNLAAVLLFFGLACLILAGIFDINGMHPRHNGQQCVNRSGSPIPMQGKSRRLPIDPHLRE